MKRLYAIFVWLLAIGFTALVCPAQAQNKKEVNFRITLLKSTGKPQPGMILKVIGKPDKYISDAQGVISFKTEIEKDFTRTASIYFPTDENKTVMNFPLEEKETHKTFYIDSPEDLVSYKQNSTTVEIEGIVKDIRGKAIAGATASIQGTGRKAVTDEMGLFKIEADYNHPIIVRADGMENLSLGIHTFIQNPEEPTLVTMHRKSSDKVYTVVDKMPEFPGGMKAFKNYLDRHLRYPVQARKTKKEGVVAVQFIVEKDGQITSPTIVRGLEASMDSAAISLIRRMPRWIAGEDHGMTVRCKYSVPVQFKISQPKPADEKKAVQKAEMERRKAEEAQLKQTIAHLCGTPRRTTLLSLANTPASPAEGIVMKKFAEAKKKRR